MNACWRRLPVALLALSVAACGSVGVHRARPGTITVVATTTQLRDLVANVGGARVDAVGILAPNVDPHEYEPKPSDAQTLSGAKLVVESGVGLDAWFAKVIASAGGQAPVWVASAGLRLRAGDSDEPAGDPHWWHDPTDFAAAATALAVELARVDPAGAGAYRANAARYVSQIGAMDRANLAELAQVPVPARRLVTNHDAFAYFAAHYRITILGTVLDSLSTSAQPSAQSIAELIAKVRSAHVRAIFTESSVNPKLEQQIAGEAGVKVYASLYGDTLGPAGSPGATYLGMERWNVRVIVAGLLGRSLPASSLGG